MRDTPIVGLSFILILIALANPFELWAPESWQYLAVVALAVVAALFVGLVYRGRAGDEREEHVRDLSARSGYLAGILVLVGAVGLSVLELMEPNVWVIGALGAMVAARLLTHLLTDR